MTTELDRILVIADDEARLAALAAYLDRTDQLGALARRARDETLRELHRRGMSIGQVARLGHVSKTAAAKILKV